MARKRDTACAGGCGQMLYGGRSSLPPGRRVCRACRRANPGAFPNKASTPVATQRACSYCGKTFDAVVYYRSGRAPVHRQSCSDRCWRLAFAARMYGITPGQSSPCTDCGADAERMTRVGPLCVRCSLARKRVRYQRRNLKRRAGGTVLMSINELADRDGWRCHICRHRVSHRLQWPHPRSPSRDHLVPVSDGGSNDPVNLALAHLACNVKRGRRGGVQLLLFG
jgi:hypothetical protein